MPYISKELVWTKFSKNRNKKRFFGSKVTICGQANMWDIRQQANHSAKNLGLQKGKLVMQNSKLENATPNVFFSVQLIKNGYEYWVLNNCFRCNFEDNRILQWWTSQVYSIDKNCHFVCKTGRGILECSHHIFVVIMMMSSRNTLPNYLANTIKKNIYTLSTYSHYTVLENPSKSPSEHSV